MQGLPPGDETDPLRTFVLHWQSGRGNQRDDTFGQKPTLCASWQQAVKPPATLGQEIDDASLGQ